MNVSHKHSRRIASNDPLLRGKQAKQIADLLEAFTGEFRYLEDMLQFFQYVLNREYPDHRRLLREMHHERDRTAHAIADLVKLQREYRVIVADEEHKFGPIETPSLLPMFNYTISIGDLLELFPVDQVVEDFLDG